MRMPQPLSVVIVCKNSAATLGRTLRSVQGLGREILAVDSGSTDGTIDLLHEHGAQVIEHPWMGYVKTKQFALERCSQPWALSLDSDESLTEPLRRAIEALDLQAEQGPTGYRVNRKVYYRNKPFEHTWQPEWRLRLVRTSRYRWRGLDPHDELAPIDPGERIEDLPGDLRHDSFSSFAELMRKHVGHAQLMAQSLHQAGRRVGPLRLAFSPVTAFVRHAIVQRGYRDGPRGWAAAGAMAAYTLMKYVCLLDIDEQVRQGPSREVPAHDGPARKSAGRQAPTQQAPAQSADDRSGLRSDAR
ncbi:MAG: beta 1,4 glucosyltransferase [Phycisphaerales bacterium]|nr:MAG: beta 1,4 glucosyltransferase [Phycisphaerales bacterium]